MGNPHEEKPETYRTQERPARDETVDETVDEMVDEMADQTRMHSGGTYSPETEDSSELEPDTSFHPEPAPDRSDDGGWASVLIPSLAAALIGGIAGWWGAGLNDPAGTGATQGSAPVVVLDTSGWMEQARTEGIDSDESADQVREVAQRLRSEGYVVLYPEAAMEVPSYRLITPDMADEILD